MIIAWMLHPLRGYGEYSSEDNLARAKRWMKWCLQNLQEVEVCADWILWCELLDDANPEERARGLRYDQEMTRRCDMVIVCGGHLSSGMQSDLDIAKTEGKMILDLTDFGDWPSAHLAVTNEAVLRLRAVLVEKQIRELAD